jgi:hypothetical protein
MGAPSRSTYRSQHHRVCTVPGSLGGCPRVKREARGGVTLRVRRCTCIDLERSFESCMPRNIS